MLEAEVAGFGASGRNGGWCSALFPASLDIARRAARRRPRGRARPAPGDARHRRRGRPGRRGRGHRRPRRQGRHDQPGPHRGPARAGPGPRSPTPARGAAARTTCGCSTPAEADGGAATRPARAGATYTPDCAAIHPAGWCAGWPRRSSAAASGSTSRPGSPRSSPAGSCTDARHGARRTSWSAPPRATPRTLHGQRRAVAPVYSLMIATEPLPARDLGRRSGCAAARRSATTGT